MSAGTHVLAHVSQYITSLFIELLLLCSSSVMFGIKRFHSYVDGHPLEIHTDHKPLLGLIGEDRGIRLMAYPRMRRWALTLSGYQYKLMYIPGRDNVVVDALSRLHIVEHSVTKPNTYLTTIRNLCRLFSTFGIQDIIVSGNKTSITGQEFKNVSEGNGNRHLTTAPYHATSDGLAERAVQTMKNGLLK